ncbi:Coenzyme PQQ synthesis protein D [Candidatus Burkholderia pumila]|uniref:Coenzyme PQQ synthesis protein D n=1 Tax=Candidatus Burkholderia pumila TaxID=1090375 RepID=A0ABR5HM78_9BURK|nr:Coenzyme PQQ synthesis protein D [Candidatus Burkholderia pumila]
MNRRTHVSERAGPCPRLRPLFHIRWRAKRASCAIVHPFGSVELSRSTGKILTLSDGVRELEARFHASGFAADVYRFIDEARGRGWID